MNQYDYEPQDMGKNNKLLCTFTSPQKLNETLDVVKTKYTILYDKIFVLELSPNEEEYLVTYNVDFNNVSSTILPQTISVHRKKETNTLYTINALNSYIDKNKILAVDWSVFKNSLLLTRKGEFHQLGTKINKVVHTN